MGLVIVVASPMDSRLIALFERARDCCVFGEDVVFDDINTVNSNRENVLHWVVRGNDLAAARLLIELGIEVNQPGDLGRTPLHEACACGHTDMALLLIEHGADMYAQTDGDVPFTLARINGHDALCDVLHPLMDRAQARDPDVWVRARITFLQRELRRLEALLK